jgi:hypothetical protein
MRIFLSLICTRARIGNHGFDLEDQGGRDRLPHGSRAGGASGRVVADLAAAVVLKNIDGGHRHVFVEAYSSE